jgi:hypothetical protein
MLKTRDADRARTALHGVSGNLIDSLQSELREALAGSDAATRAYVREYRQLTTCLLDAARTADFVAETPHGLLVGEVKVGRTRALTDVIENTAASAPFTPWVARYELGDGVALMALNTLRELLGARLLSPPSGVTAREFADHVSIDEVTAQRFMRRVRHFLNHPDDRNPLERLMEAFDLSKSELGRLFGVSRQAIDGWLVKGVPSERQEKLATLLAVTDLLERKLKAGRLPGIARRAAAAYDGQTMLDLMAADRHDELLAKVRESFDWASAA